MSHSTDQRVLVALGGNALTPHGHAGPEAQRAAVERAMQQVADLVAAGDDIGLTHRNGPQVGNLLTKNELARSVVPPVPLDWCVAQTQATIGYLIVTALDRALRERGLERAVVAIVTRVAVDAGDPAWAGPAKPIGRYLTEREAAERIAAGEHWAAQGPRAWRRVVASPEPLEIVDGEAAARLLDSGAVVVAAGGGGVPTVETDGWLHGVAAVVDKDLSGALLASSLHAGTFVVATVPGVAVGFGTPGERWLARTTPGELRALCREGHFAVGSMGPKVEACVRFVEAGGAHAVIAPLDRIVEAAERRVGTVVERSREAA